MKWAMQGWHHPYRKSSLGSATALAPCAEEGKGKGKGGKAKKRKPKRDPNEPQKPVSPTHFRDWTWMGIKLSERKCG